MKCAALESLIALHVEGDLPIFDRRRVETHLQSCTACSALAGELRESQSIFKSLRAGTVNTSELIHVRERVLNEVGDLEPAPGWVVTMHRLFFAGMRSRNAIAGVLLAALVTGSVWYSQWHFAGERKHEAPIAVARLDAPAVMDSPRTTPPPAKVPRIVKVVEPLEVLEELPKEVAVVQSVHEPTETEPQILQVPMKFVTDDPDVIIYWLPSDKGD